MDCQSEQNDLANAEVKLAAASIGFLLSIETGPGVLGGAIVLLAAEYDHLKAEQALHNCTHHSDDDDDSDSSGSTSGGSSGTSGGGGFSGGGTSGTGGTTSFGTSSGSGSEGVITVEEVQHGTPIVIDLDGDGVELISLEDSSARFDFDGDGDLDAIGWVAPDDALLIFDANANGIVDHTNEISFVSYLPGAETDLEGLAAFDTDGNGAFGVGDEQYDSFFIFQDLNQNGVSDEGELISLADAGIESISLTLTPSGEDRDGNIIINTSTFTRTDGTTGEVGDVAFAFAGDEIGTVDYTDTQVTVALADSEAESNFFFGDEDGGVLIGTSGNDFFIGGEGSDNFNVSSGGRDYISGFELGVDVLVLEGIENALENATQRGHNVIIEHSTGTVTIADIAIGQLSIEDFAEAA